MGRRREGSHPSSDFAPQSALVRGRDTMMGGGRGGEGDRTFFYPAAAAPFPREKKRTKRAKREEGGKCRMSARGKRGRRRVQNVVSKTDAGRVSYLQPCLVMLLSSSQYVLTKKLKETASLGRQLSQHLFATSNITTPLCYSTIAGKQNKIP